MLSMEGRERGEAVRMGTRERKPRKIQNQTQPLLFEFVVHFQWSDNCNSSAWATWLSHLTLPFLRSLDVFHSLHLENGVQEKKQNKKPPFLCTHMHTPQWSTYVYAYIRCIYQIIYHRCSHIYSSSSTEVFFFFLSSSAHRSSSYPIQIFQKLPFGILFLFPTQVVLLYRGTWDLFLLILLQA